MLLRVRSAVSHLVAGLGPGPGTQPPAEPRHGGGGGSGSGAGGQEGPRVAAFCRPAFLQLTPEELRRADDHTGRAVQSPRDGRRRLPWSTGYAE
ncbi:hypothetical protein CIB84_012491 [Bambusicola thoracicus]|uniref:Uncharacterized protein n=1 Tax=Bambusicola thoracicus TaxID=9083 RepID=A0A2P4SI17_BAMTH|nr:hypothetical protein CIB84_012491 [Bambusicola thoracicus]